MAEVKCHPKHNVTVVHLMHDSIQTCDKIDQKSDEENSSLWQRHLSPITSHTNFSIA